jgi:tRNA A37 N6-isopentenylltransferase MiaA
LFSPFGFGLLHFVLAVMTGTDIAVWVISALLAAGIGWSKYAKWKTRNKLVREIAAMDPERREKMLNRLDPKTAMEIREELMKRFWIR